MGDHQILRELSWTEKNYLQNIAKQLRGGFFLKYNKLRKCLLNIEQFKKEKRPQHEITKIPEINRSHTHGKLILYTVETIC